MSDQTLFNEDAKPNSDAPVADQQQEAPAADPYATLLQGIKTPDGRQKYATLSDAINSIAPKEEHISTLESENSILREEIQKIKAQMEAFTATQQVNNTDTGSTQTENSSAAVNVEELYKQFKQLSSAEEAQVKARANVDKFKQQLVSVYGEKAASVYTAKLQEAGLPENVFLQNVATNPDFAWKSLGLETTVTKNDPSLDSSRNVYATENKPVEQPKFRQSTPKAGSRIAAQREETMRRLREQGYIS